MGPGREQGGNQIETRFHQGLSWRPSWGFRWPEGLLSRAENQPCGVWREVGSGPGPPFLVTLSSPLWLVWYDVIAESQQGWSRNYPLWLKKIPWTEAENFKECPGSFQSENEQETESEEESSALALQSHSSSA